MTIRNLSPQHMFFEMAKEHKPKYHFKGRDKAAFKAWKAKAQPEVMACLGDFPKRVPANPQLLAEWEHGGLRKQRWIIDVGPRIPPP